MQDRKKLIIILNGISRKKKNFYQNILPGIQKEFNIDVVETNHQSHAIELGHQASLESPYGILAAGGDGTLNQLINGVMKSNVAVPNIGIIPLGTGNDFARMANIQPDFESILMKVKSGGKPTDLGKIKCQSEGGVVTIQYFINVASLGIGPDVVHRLFKSNRSLGPALTYFKAIAQSFFSHKPEAVNIETDNWNWSGKVRVLAIANGQSFGSGLFVGPEALCDDGLFSTFLTGEIPLFKFLWLLQKIKVKKRIVDPDLLYNRCTNLSVTSSNKCWIETEGELAGVLPATIEILPRAIKFFR